MNDDFGDNVKAAAALLEKIADDRTLLEELPESLRRRLLMAAGQVSRPDKHKRKAQVRAKARARKERRVQADQALLKRTGIRALRDEAIFQTPRLRLGDDAPPRPEPLGQTSEARKCYVCQAEFTEVHHFYDQLCVACGDVNFAKRTPMADLNGRVALVTGSRVKIGFQAAVMLLRAGCHVICTTRFPRDAARRYAELPDVDEWSDRLRIHGIDLRHTPSVERLCGDLVRDLDRLDFLINNACQTVRRPPGFYQHLMDREAGSAPLPEPARKLLASTDGLVLDPGTPPRFDTSARLSQLELVAGDAERGHHLFPAGELDADEQQVDLRDMNSWRLRLHEVPTIELLEVHLVNAVAPFILNARLKTLMAQTATHDAHIVNVSAMEGQFYRVFKTDKHPHTNMAKAALNMMTRTSAADYVKAGIHMNSVDTGWVTDEDPLAIAERKREVHRFHPPLDIVDGAARIVDPIFSGISSGKHVWGQFLKDYQITDW